MNKIVDKKPADEVTCIELDGASGEGGGQILRTALTLSMLTGQPFRIQRIRAGRAKPGLLRQHLVAVQAAAEISQATVHGAELGSQTLEFTPGVIRGGEFSFDIGSAGSTTLTVAGSRAIAAPGNCSLIACTMRVAVSKSGSLLRCHAWKRAATIGWS